MRQKLAKPKLLQAVFHLMGCSDHLGKRHTLTRVEVEHHPVRLSWIGFGGPPGMQLDRRNLGQRDQAVLVVDGEVGLAVRVALPDLRGHVAVAALLVELLLATHPVRQRTIDNGRRRNPGRARDATANQ